MRWRSCLLLVRLTSASGLTASQRRRTPACLVDVQRLSDADALVQVLVGLAEGLTGAGQDLID
jgi:hypothetical protein